MSESIDFSKLSINQLEETEHIESFNCGDSDLNDFILSESQLYQVAVSYTHLTLPTTSRV